MSRRRSASTATSPCDSPRDSVAADRTTHALSRGVLDGDDGAAAGTWSFLSAGDSLYPLDALRGAGVYPRSPEPVEQTFATLASLVDRIEALI